MRQQLWDGANIVARFHQRGGETESKGLAARLDSPARRTAAVIACITNP